MSKTAQRNIEPLRNVALLSKDTVQPANSPTREFIVYSIPAYDLGKTPEILFGKAIKSQKYILSEQCILFSKLNPRLPRVWKIDNPSENSISSTELLPLKPEKEKITLDFLYYTLTDPIFTARMKRYATGTSNSHQRVRPEQVLAEQVFVPPIHDQNKITAVLSVLDKKIELLRKQNETLEEMARAIFHEWFVEFNFPNKDGKPYKASGGKMVDSELGKIPEGWEVKPASGIADISIGRTPPRKEAEWFSLSPADIRWVSIKDMGGAGVYLKSTSEYLTKEAVERFGIPVIPANTVIVSFKLTVGRVAITTEEMLSNEAIAHFVQKDSNKTPTEYLYLWLKNFAFGTLGSTSSIANATNSQAIKKIPFLVPETPVMEVFSPLAGALFGRISANITSIQGLSVIRDTLLPKLTSGEVRIDV